MAGHLKKSNAAACTSRLVFPERKRRKNKPFGQEIARKIVRFSDFRSLLPSQWKSSDFHCTCQKYFFDTQERPIFIGRSFIAPLRII